MRSKFFQFLILIIVLSSCTSYRGSKNIFRMNHVQGVESLDPAFAKTLNIMWHIHNLYNRLLEFDEKNKAIPSLAKSWTVSEDRKTYRFILRDDVYFHDDEAFPNGKGRRMVAADVQYSFSRLMDPETASPGAWVFNDRVDSLQPFVAVNDTVFELHLQKPFHPILGILSMQYCSIVPREVVEKWGKDFRSHPCGTGPFVFQYWEEAVAITYQKNNHYWEKDSNGVQLPYLDGIKATFVDSKATEFLMFMQGDLDFINGIDVSFKDQVLSKKGELKKQYESKIVLHKHAYLNVEYLGFLLDSSKTKQGVLLDRRIRQAINLGFDRRKLITYVRNNIGKPAENGMVPPGVDGYDAKAVPGFQYDAVKAKQLIEEVKKEKGRLPEITLLSNDNYSDRCQFIASELQQLGLKIKVEIMQPMLLREQMSDSKADFFWATWIADYPDADSYLTMFYGKNTAPPNYTRYMNKEYDQLYDQFLEENDSLKCISLQHQMDQMVLRDAACVPLFYDEVMHFTQKNISNWSTNSLNLLELKKVRKSE